MIHSVAAFYKFVFLPDVERLHSDVSARCRELKLKGTVLLANEGINATVAGERADLLRLIEFLKLETSVGHADVKWSEAGKAPFRRLKVKVKQEIVTFGAVNANPALRTGHHVAPRDWNALISEPGLVVIDTRNAYEVAIGTFRGAVNPQTQVFSEFAKFVEDNLSPARTPKIAMFCTGGIRCEKASAFMLQRGFEAVYQLDGGVLRYIETIPKEDSLFDGECFVFDERVALNHDLCEGSHKHCGACGLPASSLSEANLCTACCENSDNGQRVSQSSRKRRVAIG